MRTAKEVLRLFDAVVAEANHQFGLSEQYQDREEFDRLCDEFRAALGAAAGGPEGAG